MGTEIIRETFGRRDYARFRDRLERRELWGHRQRRLGAVRVEERQLRGLRCFGRSGNRRFRPVAVEPLDHVGQVPVDMMVEPVRQRRSLAAGDE